MSREKYTPEVIMGMLREAEVRLSQGQKLKELARENARLCKAVSELTLDKMILNEALTGKS